jgi:hypothetical protein
MAEHVKHPDVVVELSGASTEAWQAAVQAELRLRLGESVADKYLAETRPLMNYPDVSAAMRSCPVAAM